MDDLISRQAAIDALTDYCENKCVNREDAWCSGCHYGISEYVLKALPSAQPEQRWIPVSERLPEDIKPVIVTWKNTDPESYYQYIVGKHFIGTAHYKSGKWYWYSGVTEDLLAEYGEYEPEEFDEAIEVVAWMPLPEPPKEEQDGNA